jgi:hypothetical protein
MYSTGMGSGEPRHTQRRWKVEVIDIRRREFITLLGRQAAV